MFIAVAMPTEIIILIAIKVLDATKLEAFKTRFDCSILTKCQRFKVPEPN